MEDEEVIIQKFENALIPFATQRFDISQSPATALLGRSFMGKSLLGKFAARAQERIVELITWIARAFIKTLITANESMHLSEIATMAISEALYMMNYPPYYFTFGSGEEGAKADMKITIETEMHRWFMFLIEQGLLSKVGLYHRYMGIFKPNKT